MLAFTPHELKLLRLGTRYNNNKPRDPVKFREGDTDTYKQEVRRPTKDEGGKRSGG